MLESIKNLIWAQSSSYLPFVLKFSSCNNKRRQQHLAPTKAVTEAISRHAGHGKGLGWGRGRGDNENYESSNRNKCPVISELKITGPL